MMDQRSAGTDYEVTPVIGIRIASLPVTALADLRLDQTSMLIEEIVAIDEWLQAEGKALSDVLYSVIGDTLEPGLKPLLVGLRRAVFTGRNPAGRTWSEPVRQALPHHARERVYRWMSQVERRATATQRLPALMENEQIVKEERLRETVTRTVFQHGLLRGSPVLFRELEKWIGAPTLTLPERKVALRLAKYLARAVAKISPYSTFTVSGIGYWDDGASAATQFVGTWRWKSVVELNAWLFEQVSRALIRLPELSTDLQVRLNPTALETDSHLQFVRVADGESLGTIPMNEALRHCLEYIAAAPKCSVRDLCEHFVGLGLENQHRSHIEQYVQTLVSVGVLEICPPFAEQALDHIRELAEWLAACKPPELSRLAEPLRELHHELRDYPQLNSPQDRYRCHEAVRQELSHVFSALRLDPEFPGKNIMHETAIFNSPVVVCQPRHWREILADLDAIRRFCALFQADLPFKLAAARVFTERYGESARIPFVSFYRTLQEIIAGKVKSPVSPTELQAYLMAPFPGHWPLTESTVPEIKEIHRLRAQARLSLQEQALDDTGRLVVHRSHLDAHCVSWPSYVRPTESVSCYVQPLGCTDGLRVVLNEMNIGYGRGYRRIQNLGFASDGVGSYQSREYRHPQNVLAESDARFGSSLNSRLPATKRVIEYPLAISHRDPEDRIFLSDLIVTLDPENQLLQISSQRIGAPVRPLHLGLLGELWLPPMFKLLVRAFGEPQSLIYQAWSPFFDLEGWADAWQSRTMRSGRIDVGSVTVARHSTYLLARDVPRCGKGETRASYLLRMRGWRREHAIPDSCYVRVLEPEWLEGRVSPLQKSRKPMYVDFANWFLVAAFERALTRPDNLVVFQEALPALTDAPRYGDEGPHVTEYIIELSSGVSVG